MCDLEHPAPEAVLNEIFAEDLLRSPEGQAFQRRLLVQYYGLTEEEAVERLAWAEAQGL